MHLFFFFGGQAVGQDEGLRYTDYSNSCNENNDTDTGGLHMNVTVVFSLSMREDLFSDASVRQ
jgi:hypothetical protein